MSKAFKYFIGGFFILGMIPLLIVQVSSGNYGLLILIPIVVGVLMLQQRGAKIRVAQTRAELEAGHEEGKAYIVRHLAGETNPSTSGVVLRSGEKGIYRMANVPLRVMKSVSEWKSGSRGVSIPVHLGHSTFRLRSGARAGHRVSADHLMPAGEVSVLLTNQRVMLFGSGTKSRIFNYTDGLTFQPYTNGLKLGNETHDVVLMLDTKLTAFVATILDELVSNQASN